MSHDHAEEAQLNPMERASLRALHKDRTYNAAQVRGIQTLLDVVNRKAAKKILLERRWRRGQ